MTQVFNRVFSVALTFLASGCAANYPRPIQSPPPEHYLEETAIYVRGLPQPDRFKGAMVSDLEKTVAPQPGDWYACLKLSDGSVYAVFFGSAGIEDFRLTLGVDHCALTDRLLDSEKRAGYVERPHKNGASAIRHYSTESRRH